MAHCQSFAKTQSVVFDGDLSKYPWMQVFALLWRRAIQQKLRYIPFAHVQVWEKAWEKMMVQVFNEKRIPVFDNYPVFFRFDMENQK